MVRLGDGDERLSGRAAATAFGTVLAEGRLVADETARVFGRLSVQQVNWKPASGSGASASASTT